MKSLIFQSIFSLFKDSFKTSFLTNGTNRNLFYRTSVMELGMVCTGEDSFFVVRMITHCLYLWHLSYRRKPLIQFRMVNKMNRRKDLQRLKDRKDKRGRMRLLQVHYHWSGTISVTMVRTVQIVDPCLDQNIPSLLSAFFITLYIDTIIFLYKVYCCT